MLDSGQSSRSCFLAAGTGRPKFRKRQIKWRRKRKGTAPEFRIIAGSAKTLKRLIAFTSQLQSAMEDFCMYRTFPNTGFFARDLLDRIFSSPMKSCNSSHHHYSSVGLAQIKQDALPCLSCRVTAPATPSLQSHRRRPPQRRRQPSSVPTCNLDRFHPLPITPTTLVFLTTLPCDLRPSFTSTRPVVCILTAFAPSFVVLYNHLNRSFGFPGYFLTSREVWSHCHTSSQRIREPHTLHQRMCTIIMSRLNVFRSALLLAAALPAVFAQASQSCGDGNLCPSSAPCCSRE